MLALVDKREMPGAGDRQVAPLSLLKLTNTCNKVQLTGSFLLGIRFESVASWPLRGLKFGPFILLLVNSLKCRQTENVQVAGR